MVSLLCYRCANQLEQGVAFCPFCGAPQIRVTAPEEAPVLRSDDRDETAVLPPDTAFSVGPGSWRAIEWRSFLRISLPLAFLAGTLSVFLPPVGLALVPASVVLAIARYRKDHCPNMTPSQGGWLGACTGLLSFIFFLIFAGIETFTNSTEMRQIIVKTLEEQVARNPDPNFQQMANWLVTPAGIVFFFALLMMMFLALFVGLATVTGTLTAAFSGNRARR